MSFAPILFCSFAPLLLLLPLVNARPQQSASDGSSSGTNENFQVPTIGEKEIASISQSVARMPLDELKAATKMLDFMHETKNKLNADAAANNNSFQFKMMVNDGYTEKLALLQKFIDQTQDGTTKDKAKALLVEMQNGDIPMLNLCQQFRTFMLGLNEAELQDLVKTMRSPKSDSGPMAIFGSPIATLQQMNGAKVNVTNIGAFIASYDHCQILDDFLTKLTAIVNPLMASRMAAAAESGPAPAQPQAA